MKFKPKTRDAPGIRTHDPQSDTLTTALLRTENRRAERRGAGPGCRKILTLYAVEDRLGFAKKNDRKIAERKFVDLSFETKSRKFLSYDGRDIARRKQAI